MVAAIPDTTVAQLFAGDGEHSSRPPDRITLLALAFLALPLLIFLATWLKPMYAVAGIGLMLLATAAVAGRFRPEWPSRNLTVLVLVALAWAAMGGGSHFVYANPDWHVRDAVLGDLAFSAWPPSYGFRDGHHDLLRSAIGFFLPVAAAAKLLGPQALPMLMFAWTGIGTLLFLLLLPLPREGLPGLLAGIAIIVAFSGMDVLGAFLLHGHERIRGNCFHLRNNQMRLLGFKDPAESLAIQHVDDMRPVRHLHGRSMGIAVDGDHFAAKPLEFDDDFLAQFAGTEKGDAGGGGGKWCADGCHGCGGNYWES